MLKVHEIAFRSGSKEEVLPGLLPDFPYIVSCSEVDQFAGRLVPWHWHKEVELFYMERGTLEYNTPGGTCAFPAGSGGLLNANILHMTRPQGAEPVSQLLHIFDPVLIGGHPGSRIQQKYVTPFVTAPQIELLPFFPDVPAHQALLRALAASFRLSESDDAYELRLRSMLSEIWRMMLPLAAERLAAPTGRGKSDDKLKQMMIYIHEHYAEKLSITALAGAAFVSERACYRAFQDGLHMTPYAYLQAYRLQRACHMLAHSRDSITAISQACGLGSSSYFGKIFREQLGCTPMDYRRKWQDPASDRQEPDSTPPQTAL